MKHATTVKVQGPSRSIPGSQKPKTCYGIVLHPRPFRCRRVANDNEVLSHAVRKSGESSRPKTTKKCAVQLLESRSWGVIRTNQTRGILDGNESDMRHRILLDHGSD